MDDSQDVPAIDLETPSDDVFVAPSIDNVKIVDGQSYSYFSDVPKTLAHDMSVECVLGVDEAGRGPVIGPMVYGIYYLPTTMHKSLLTESYHFDDSKVLTPEVRSSLMESICTPETDLHESCGWATRVMSARDISSAQLRPHATYNLNAQAMDATIDLIKGVFARQVNIKEIYVDTIGDPATYQRKLQLVFPTAKVTVAKKADSLYPCVSAASICAKVTRDAALEVSYRVHMADRGETVDGWGSGYPSDARCSTWLKRNKDPIFGWGNECRFSWSTAKDLLDARPSVKVAWPAAAEDEDDSNMKLTDFAMVRADTTVTPGETQLSRWFGGRVSEAVF